LWGLDSCPQGALGLRGASDKTEVPHHVAHAHREEAHRTRRKTRSYDIARGSQRKISRADGFQAKASEACSSAARNPEPGPVVGATENKFPQKGSCEGRGFISTPT